MDLSMMRMRERVGSVELSYLPLQLSFNRGPAFICASKKFLYPIIPT